jgi:hypothetical protein
MTKPWKCVGSPLNLDLCVLAGDVPAEHNDAPSKEELTAGDDPKTESAPPAQEAAATQR